MDNFLLFQFICMLSSAEDSLLHTVIQYYEYTYLGFLYNYNFI